MMITKRKVREGEPVIAVMSNKLAINTVEDSIVKPNSTKFNLNI